MSMALPRTILDWTGSLVVLLALTGAVLVQADDAAAPMRSIPIAIVQFDAVPEAVAANLHTMERLARQAAKKGARWIVFHEGTICDYTDRLDQLAETVPGGPSTRRMERLAKALGCFICFGLSEKDGEHFYITHVFVGPEGFIYRYRKTWLHKDPADRGYRNEYARYDPGTGPELFTIDGVRATCFICADATSPRCVKRARALRPQIGFHPVNIVTPDAERLRADEAALARAVGAPLIVPNRVGDSWMHKSGKGGAAVFSAQGQLLAGANGDGKEEVVVYQLTVPPR
jgi:predicted amidohydrolase